MVLLQTGISAHSLLVSVQRTIGDSSVNWFETRVCNNIQGTNSWGAGRPPRHRVQLGLSRMLQQEKMASPRPPAELEH